MAEAEDDRSFEDRMREAMRKYGVDPDSIAGLRRTYDPALVPTEEVLGDRKLDPELGRLKDQIEASTTVFDIYDRFMPSAKKRAEPKPGQRESILFSCPSPDHPDANPSAWTNIDGLWYCGACGAKGDKYTIAALAEGFDTKKDFPKVITRIAEIFGMEYTKYSTKAPEVYEPPPRGALEPPAPLALPAAPVPDAPPAEWLDPEPEPSPIPILKWRDLFPPDSFIRKWMDAMHWDDIPDEFYLWIALQMIGMAIGRDVYFNDYPKVHGNLYLILYGSSGLGKSRALAPMREALRKALPYDYTDPESKGVMLIALPGSPEALVDSFSAPILDPSTGKTIGYGSVRGLLEVDEWASLLSKGDRSTGMKSRITSMYEDSTASIRSRGHGEVIAENVFCSMIATTQPNAVAEFIKTVDLHSGFANRWIPIVGTPKKMISRRTARDPSPAIDALIHIHTWASFGRVIDFDGPGNARFEAFFQEELVPLKLSDNAMFVRIDLTMKKLILLIAANERTTTATLDIVERAIAFFPYLKHCYEFFSGSISAGTDSEIAEWIDRRIRAHVARKGQPPTGRDLQKDAHKKYDVKQLKNTLLTMETLGIVRQVTLPNPDPTKKHRPVTRWMLTELVAP